MTIDQLVKVFQEKKHNLEMGAGKLAARYGVSKNDIYKAKEIVRDIIRSSELSDLKADIKDSLAKYIGSETSESGTTKKFESIKPLSPKEIEELAGVDGINTFVARVWDKLQPNGIWTYSIDIRYNVRDFYNPAELKEKLKELMPNLTPVNCYIPAAKEQTLVVCLADDHVGAVNISNTFTRPLMSYQERLERVFKEIVNLDSTFTKIILLSLGDQLNGWNSQTTRGGHEVKSLSNKEQFDIYTGARSKFYDSVFSSGLAKEYWVIDVENSNHSGNGFSYMANQFLDLFVQTKYPDVLRASSNELLDYIIIGNDHIIVFGHGKDEKFMKKPMPAVLNAKTDLYIYDYILTKGYNPIDTHITLYKGDLHQHGIQMGKFGRYVNVPSIAGNSDFGDANFGNTKGGALLEIIDNNSYRIWSQAIWF